MIITMKPGAKPKDVDYVVLRAHSLGLETHISQEGARTLINLMGDLHGVPTDAFHGLHGVDDVVSLDQPFRFASREYKAEKSLVAVGNCVFGDKKINVIAGPCAVENKDQLMKTARLAKEAGATMLRGGAFKPRTSPYSFQGLGEEGLKYLSDARDETGLYIVTEVLSSEQVPLVCEYADVLQIGTRNMNNYQLLHAVGETTKPVLLKRGMMSTVHELLMSSEYILSHGNRNVILCERGIRTFETATRNTLDVTAIPLLQNMTHLPIIADPSHATGRSDMVSPASLAAIAAGADGLLIEMHLNPDRALSDGYQSLSPDQFKKLMIDIDRVAHAVDRYVLED